MRSGSPNTKKRNQIQLAVPIEPEQGFANFNRKITMKS